MENKPKRMISDTIELVRDLEECIRIPLEGMAKSSVQYESSCVDGRYRARIVIELSDTGEEIGRK